MWLRRTRITVIVACVAMLSLFIAAPASADRRHDARPVEITTIADGFVAPLGLAVKRSGTAYVVEAFTGVLTRVSSDGEKTVLYTAPEGAGLAGGVDVVGHRLWFTRSAEAEEGELQGDTTLDLLRDIDESRTIASLWEHELRENPDAGATYGFTDLSDECLAQVPEDFLPQPYDGIVESNPYAVAAGRGGTFVADAAGNTVLRVSRSGRVSTVAVLPPVPQLITADIASLYGLPDCTVGEVYRGEPVPTDVEIGHDGALYVTSLPGSPEAPGSGSVWRIRPWSGKATRVATGLDGAVDLAVAHDGTIYVAELFGGAISTVRHGKVRTLAEVPTPATVEIGRHGTLYATINVFEGENPGNGTLVAIAIGRHRR